MSEYITNTQQEITKLNWAHSFERDNAFPLDKSSLFDSYEDAVAYAKGDGSDKRGLGKTAYVGQIIAVFSNSINKANGGEFANYVDDEISIKAESYVYKYTQFSPENIMLYAIGIDKNLIALNHNSTINVKDFGAKGNDYTDDTQAIQLAVNVATIANNKKILINTNTQKIINDKPRDIYEEYTLAENTLGAKIYFPAGTYIISQPIHFQTFGIGHIDPLTD